MNELNKLIEQYKSQTGRRAEIWEGPVFYGYTKEFMEWQLASRPTCGVEQRKFLDEIETGDKLKKDHGSLGYVIYIPDSDPIAETSLFQKDFTADLSKVAKGE